MRLVNPTELIAERLGDVEAVRMLKRAGFDAIDWSFFEMTAGHGVFCTDAWKEHAQKTKDYSKGQWQSAEEGLNAIFGEFALCMKEGHDAESEKAQTLAAKLQSYITDNFYTCTKQILAGLGQMYVMDKRFTANIDKNGEGTADFVSRTIGIYCQK